MPIVALTRLDDMIPTGAQQYLPFVCCFHIFNAPPNLNIRIIVYVKISMELRQRRWTTWFEWCQGNDSKDETHILYTSSIVKDTYLLFVVVFTTNALKGTPNPLVTALDAFRSCRELASTYWLCLWLTGERKCDRFTVYIEFEIRIEIERYCRAHTNIVVETFPLRSCV